ncbi:MAG: hypothetical protein GYB66_10235 [Chloroflexi bacterium]|nr:hypothetical protein [Chloroflexota bacterium]
MRKWVLILTAVFLVLLALNIVPELRGGWGWRWPYAKPSDLQPVAFLAGVVAAYLGGVVALRWRIPRNVPLSLAWTVIGGFCLAMAVQHVRDNPFFMLFSHTVSPVQTGASTVAVQYMGVDGAGETLRQWPDVMREADEKNIIHFTTSPPGQPLLHHWAAELIGPLDTVSKPASRALRDYQCTTLAVMQYTRGEITSAGLGMLMPLWSAMAAVPIFFAAQLLTDRRAVALRVAQWWPLVPSLLLFAPTWSTFYPLVVATALACMMAGLKYRRRTLYVLAGGVMSLGTFLNFAVLPIVALLGLYTLGYWFSAVRHDHEDQRGKYGWVWPVGVGLWFLVGLSSVWVVFGIYAGHTPYDILRVSFDQHLDIERNYFIWLFLHLYDLLMFAGWPLVALSGWGLWQALQHVRQRAPLTGVDLLVISLVVTLIVLDITGLTRGESARIWLFFVPFLLLAGVEAFHNSVYWDLPLMLGQATAVVVMGAVLPVVSFDMTPPVEGPRTDVPRLDFLQLGPLEAEAGSQEYAGRFYLQGYRYIPDPAQQMITIEFVWAGDIPSERPYRFQLVATAENDIDGEIESAPYQWYPQGGNYLTTCWDSDDTIHDTVVMPLPPVSEPVVWELNLKLVDVRTGDVIIFKDAAGELTDHVVLGPVNYP